MGGVKGGVKVGGVDARAAASSSAPVNAPVAAPPPAPLPRLTHTHTPSPHLPAGDEHLPHLVAGVRLAPPQVAVCRKLVGLGGLQVCQRTRGVGVWGVRGRVQGRHNAPPPFPPLPSPPHARTHTHSTPRSALPARRCPTRCSGWHTPHTLGRGGGGRGGAGWGAAERARCHRGGAGHPRPPTTLAHPSSVPARRLAHSRTLPAPPHRRPSLTAAPPCPLLP